MAFFFWFATNVDPREWIDCVGIEEESTVMSTSCMCLKSDSQWRNVYCKDKMDR